MPDRPIGTSFAPTNGDRQANGNGGPDGIQRAIQTLSLRLPRIVGRGAIAPASLLSGGAGAGNPLMAVLASLLRQSAVAPNQVNPPPGAPVPTPGQRGPASEPQQLRSQSQALQTSGVPRPRIEFERGTGQPGAPQPPANIPDTPPPPREVTPTAPPPNFGVLTPDELARRQAAGNTNVPAPDSPTIPNLAKLLGFLGGNPF